MRSRALESAGAAIKMQEKMVGVAGFEPTTPSPPEIGNIVIPIQPSRSHSSQRMPVQITPNTQNEPLRTEMNTDDRDRAAKQ